MRRLVSVLCLLLAGLLLTAAVLGWWADDQLLNTDAVVEVATEALDDPAVRAGVVERIRNDMILASAVDQIQPTVIAATVDDPAFRLIFADAVRRGHEFLIDPDQDYITIDLDGYSELLKDAAGRIDPSLPAAIDGLAVDLGGIDLSLVTLDRSTLPSWWNLALDARNLIPFLAVSGVLLAVLGIAADPRPARAMTWFGALTALLGGAAALAVWGSSGFIANGATTVAERAAVVRFVELLDQSLVIRCGIVAVVGAALCGVGLLANRLLDPRAPV